MGRPDHAEVFARRSIGKISELMQLQNKSSTPIRSEEEQSYREAAIKLGLMVFRRTVFESRKKTKSILRTKAKPPLKDILHQVSNINIAYIGPVIYVLYLCPVPLAKVSYRETNH